ncbi:MAG: HAMP domain-containing sensor histidine kinase [Acidimicrobiia bacterium]|nr:HAMP domain-containing sensor histidine kinase [Acidimicrobiia bacterium]
MEKHDLGAFLGSDRPPIELADYNNIYRRARIAVNVLIALAAMAVGNRLDHRTFVVAAIMLGCVLIISHVYIRRRASLLEVLVWDTMLYLAMITLIDLPEVAMFVALAQSFMVFLFIPVRRALWAMSLFIAAGIAVTTITTIMPLQRRSAAEAVVMAVIVVVLTMFPVSWVLLRAGAEVHRQRAQKERLLREKDDLLADKDRFVASISHELRTPLTAVVGLAHTLYEANGTLPDSERDEFVGILVEQSEEVAAIVDDLLVAARAETGHLSLEIENVDLIDEVNHTVPPGIPIDVDESRQHLVLGDPIRIRQILRNLVSNAHRYGGSEIRVRVSSAGAVGKVEVSDNGEPIPFGEAELIFSPYGRAHDRPGQTDSVGLGLTVSRQLARLMGGDVTYAHDGKWTVFSLTLPTGTAGATAAIKASPETARLAHRALARR